MPVTDWAMRRLLAFNRDAAIELFKAPDDGRKWTISALSYARKHQPGIDWIDAAFWPGHCQEAYEATMEGRPLEIWSWRSRRGAARVLWRLVTQWHRLPLPPAKSNG